MRKVLRAALLELSETGYSELRIEDVALRAGVNKTTIYRRWPTKEELVRALLLSISDRSRLHLPDTGSFRGDLIALARLRKKGMESVEGRSVVRMLSAERADPEVRAIARTIQKARETEPNLILQRAVDRGELARPEDGALVFEVMRALAVAQFATQGEAFDENFFGRVMDALLYGVLNKRANLPSPSGRGNG